MGRYSAQGDSAYHMSKLALESVSDSLRLEMRPCGVGVSIIEPGKFDAATTCSDPDIVIINDTLTVLLSLLIREWITRAQGGSIYYQTCIIN